MSGIFSRNIDEILNRMVLLNSCHTSYEKPKSGGRIAGEYLRNICVLVNSIFREAYSIR